MIMREEVWKSAVTESVMLVAVMRLPQQTSCDPGARCTLNETMVIMHVLSLT